MRTSLRFIRRLKTEMKSDEEYMREALRLAREAYKLGETPVGCVVVYKPTGEIIGRGFNRREMEKSPLCHAEIIALDGASRKLGGWRIVNSELFVTLEPCPMCAGAIINSRIERVVYGAPDHKAGSLESVQRMFDMPYNHKPEVVSGVLGDECAGILSEFFRELRAAKPRRRGGSGVS